jgi:hypothetical protein
MTKIVTPVARQSAQQLEPSSLIASLTTTALALRDEQFEPAFDRHSDDQGRFYAARDALQAASLPAELIVASKSRHLAAFTMVFSDASTETRQAPPEVVRLESLEQVMDYCDGDAERAAPYLARLQPWLEATAPLRQRLTKVEAAMRRSGARQQSTCEAMYDGALAILQAPALSIADVLAKMQGYCRVLRNSAEVAGLDAVEDCQPLLQALERDLAQLGGEAAGPAGSDWREAFETYQAAEKPYRALCDIDDHALDDMHLALDPACRAPSLHQRDGIRWLHLDAFDDEVLLTPEVKTALRPRVEAAIAQRDSYFKRGCSAEREQRDAELERLGDLKDAALDQLLDTPPPSLAAFLYALEQRLWWLDDDKVGVSDPGYVAFCLNSYIDAAYPMQTYIDALHLAGRTYRVPEALNFNPVAWIKAYEATKGLVGEADAALVVAYPDLDTLQARRLRTELAKAPWKYRAVQLAAQKRREEGGDPFRDAAGQAGDRDRRNPTRRFHGFVKRADHVAFTIDRANGRAVPHLERIDNIGAPYMPAAFGVSACAA